MNKEKLQEIIKIVMNKELGSREIAIMLLEALKKVDRDEIPLIYKKVEGIQPSMAIIKNIFRKIIFEEYSPEDIINIISKMDEKIFLNLKKLLPKKKNIIATISRSATLYKIFIKMMKKRLLERVIISESRPSLEGVSFAEQLFQNRIPTTLVPDAILPSIVKEVDMVIIGCDAILYNYDIVNKSGSFALSIASKFFGRPFIVLGDEYKFADPKEIKIKFGEREEIYNGLYKEIDVYNPIFEVIPHNLITWIVLNNDIISPNKF